MIRMEYYLIPAEHCGDAVSQFRTANMHAMTAKQTLLKKYGADAVVTGDTVEGLAWTEEPRQLPGFTLPRWDDRLKAWVQKPKKSSLLGKRAVAVMAELSKLFEHRMWSLEKALGVYGCVFGFHRGQRCFVYSTAYVTSDECVVVALPCAPGDSLYTSSMPAPAAPAHGRVISRAEACQLTGQLLP